MEYSNKYCLDAKKTSKNTYVLQNADHDHALLKQKIYAEFGQNKEEFVHIAAYHWIILDREDIGAKQ